MTTPIAIHVRIRPNTALARLWAAQEGQTPTDRIHALAERLEALIDVRGAVLAGIENTTRRAVVEAMRIRDEEQIPF